MVRHSQNQFSFTALMFLYTKRPSARPFEGEGNSWTQQTLGPSSLSTACVADAHCHLVVVTENFFKRRRIISIWFAAKGATDTQTLYILSQCSHEDPPLGAPPDPPPSPSLSCSRIKDPNEDPKPTTTNNIGGGIGQSR